MNEINTIHGALNETASAVSSEKVIPGTTRDSGTNQISTSLPQGYLAHGYNDKHGNQDIRYVLSYAQKIAAKLAPMEKELFRASIAGFIMRAVWKQHFNFRSDVWHS